MTGETPQVTPEVTPHVPTPFLTGMGSPVIPMLTCPRCHQTLPLTWSVAVAQHDMNLKVIRALARQNAMLLARLNGGITTDPAQIIAGIRADILHNDRQTSPAPDTPT